MNTELTQGAAALRDALHALAARNFDEAIACAERALRGDLDAGEPPDERGIVYDKPEHSRAHYVIGSALLEQGHPLAALAALDDALRFDPNDAVSMSNRAVAKRELGDEPGALEDFGRAIARAPRYAHARANRARLLTVRGEFAAAEVDYLHLLGVAPTVDHRREWDDVRARRGLPHDDEALRDELGRLLR